MADVLQQLHKLLDDDHLQICLNDCFVDWVESRADGQQIQVMKPGRDVAEQIERHPGLKGALQGALYQHEYRVLDDSFPYQELTLAQVGIPVWDILQIITAQGNVYVEMKKE